MSSHGGRLSRRERKLAAEKARRVAEVQRRKLHLVAVCANGTEAVRPATVALQSDGTTGLSLAPPPQDYAAGENAAPIAAEGQPISERRLRTAAAAEPIPDSSPDEPAVRRSRTPVLAAGAAGVVTVLRHDTSAPCADDRLFARYLEELAAKNEDDEVPLIRSARNGAGTGVRERRPISVIPLDPRAADERLALLQAVERYVSQMRELRIDDGFTQLVRSVEDDLWRQQFNSAAPRRPRDEDEDAEPAPVASGQFSYDRRAWFAELKNQEAWDNQFLRALESVLLAIVRYSCQISSSASYRSDPFYGFASWLWRSRYSARSALAVLGEYQLGYAALREVHVRLAEPVSAQAGPDDVRFHLYAAHVGRYGDLVLLKPTLAGARAWHAMRRRLLFVGSELARALREMYGD